MAFGLYIHIPYCHAKCRYCDFYSQGASRQVPQEYVQALLREMEDLPRPHTLYLGGGTPSLLSPRQVSDLIEKANPLPGSEITLEANPETLSPALLKGFRETGVNRLSIGVQTAYDSQLKVLGRLHTAAQARECFDWARAAGFENISGDIMMALPGYTREEFQATLDLIVQGGATHISAYLLKIEPGTAFGRKPPAHLPDEDQAADFYLEAVAQLEALGYHQYEISNFARPGFEGQHNLIYWNCEDYLGLGPAAHSCMGGKRFYWPSSTQSFIEGSVRPTEDGICDGWDYIILRLRLVQGLDLALLRERYGIEFSSRQMAFLKQCVQAGYARLENGVLALTPRGMIIQNTILTQLME